MLIKSKDKRMYLKPFPLSLYQIPVKNTYSHMKSVNHLSKENHPWNPMLINQSGERTNLSSD